MQKFENATIFCIFLEQAQLISNYYAESIEVV